MTQEYDYKDGEFVLRQGSGMLNATGVAAYPVARTIVKVAVVGVMVFFVYKLVNSKK